MSILLEFYFILAVAGWGDVAKRYAKIKELGPVGRGYLKLQV